LPKYSLRRRELQELHQTFEVHRDGEEGDDDEEEEARQMIAGGWGNCPTSGIPL